MATRTKDFAITNDSPYPRSNGHITVRGTVDQGKIVTVTLTFLPTDGLPQTGISVPSEPAGNDLMWSVRAPAEHGGNYTAKAESVGEKPQEASIYVI